MPNSYHTLANTPGKIYRQQKGRLTKAISWNGQACFVKLHSGVGWREIFKNIFQGRLPILGAKTEHEALQLLAQHGIPSLAVVAFNVRGWNPATQRSYLITEALHNTISLEALCEQWIKSPPSIAFKRAIIREVAKMATQMHACGLNHRDFYLCHFLLDEKIYSKTGEVKLYLIDLHRAQMRPKVPYRWRLKDIAGLYFSALNLPLTRRDFFLFMRHYHSPPSSLLQGEEGSMKHQLVDHSFWLSVEKKAWTLYAKTFFKKIHHRGIYVTYDPNHTPDDLLAQLPTPEKLLAQATLLKEDATTTVAKTHLKDQTILIKRYNARKFSKIIKRRFGLSRAARSWYQALRLRHLQIATPRPLAKIEHLRFGIIRESYIITEYLPGSDIAQFLKQEPRALKNLAAQIKMIFHSLAACWTTHGDMKATNLWVHNNQIYLLDLDATQSYANPKNLLGALHKDYQRFLKNWRDMPEIMNIFL